VRELTTPSAIAFFLMVVLASGCDRLYRPLVYNNLSRPVAIKVIWENGNSGELNLAPHQFLHAGTAESSVHSLHVSIDGEEIQVLSASDLERLAGSVGVDEIALAVDEDGLRVMSSSEVEAIRRSQPR